MKTPNLMTRQFSLPGFVAVLAVCLLSSITPVSCRVIIKLPANAGEANASVEEVTHRLERDRHQKLLSLSDKLNADRTEQDQLANIWHRLMRQYRRRLLNKQKQLELQAKLQNLRDIATFR